jgi:26S proteasome regulatory subunit N2
MLLDDTQPEEEKSLLEEKLKKVTIERAPVAGQPLRGAGGRSGGRSSRNALGNLVNPAHPPIPALEQLLQSQGLSGRSPFSLINDPQTPSNNAPGAGAAAAAGVLTAVDEDEEGDEEAPVPDEFEYWSDGSVEEEE